MLFPRPENFIFKQGISFPICEEDGKKRDSNHSLGDEMRLHFKLVHDQLKKVILDFAELVTWDIFLRPLRPLRLCKKSYQASRTMHTIYFLLRLIFILFTLLLRVVFGAICFPFCLGLGF